MEAGALKNPARVGTLIVLAFLIGWTMFSSSLTAWPALIQFLLLLVLCLTFSSIFLKRVSSPTPSGAIVMAIGIYVNGALTRFTFLNLFAPAIARLLLVILLIIAGSYVRALFRRTLYRDHLSHPVRSFAAGTWVAGISVCGISLAQRIPEWRPFVQVLLVANTLLWVYYISLMIRNFFIIIRTDHGKNVHGVLLLSTVSTQSLVIAWRVAFGTSAAYRAVAPYMMGFGVLLYSVSFLLIARRYLNVRHGIDLAGGWFNTNCIIHGAMSITGLATAVSGVVSANVTLAIWLWVLGWFIIVEAVEIARAVVRIRAEGFRRGLGVYDPTQWSRNFTFGMLYAFTLSFNIENSSAVGSFLIPLRGFILNYFGWLVLIVLLVEGGVFFGDRFRIGPSRSANRIAPTD